MPGWGRAAQWKELAYHVCGLTSPAAHDKTTEPLIATHREQLGRYWKGHRKAYPAKQRVVLSFHLCQQGPLREPGTGLSWHNEDKLVILRMVTSSCLSSLLGSWSLSPAPSIIRN